jgi:UDP-glucose 4-epimerase
MRVLVTGATGFVGSAAVPELAQRGHHIRAAVRERTTTRFEPHIEIVRHGDLGAGIDWAALVADCNAVVHLAGIAHGGPETSGEQYDRINRHATAELVSAAERAGIARFILVSSIRAQSGPTADHMLTEADDAWPTDAYGTSKLAAEMVLRASRLRYTILRPVVVYGAGVKGNLAALAQLAASPWPLPFGALANRRSLLNRASLIDAIELALRSAATVRETYIVADREPISLRDLVAALRRGLDRRPLLIPVPRPLLRAALHMAGKSDLLRRLDGELMADPSKLIAAGWTPTIDTARALEQLAKQLLMR